MAILRQEIHNIIDEIPEISLSALKPLLLMMKNDFITIETDLTEAEKKIVENGRQEYLNGEYTTLSF